MSANVPLEYDPAYCEGVHALCEHKNSVISAQVNDIHGAVFGSKEQPGLIQLMARKLSSSAVKWFVAIFAVPALVAGLAIYEFYVAAPLTYSTKIEVNATNERVLKMEEQVSRLPTAAQIKDVVVQALQETPR